jgi:eukaryotic-like serine/threonine-protein kinase
MDAERWERICSLFGSTLCTEPAEREAFLRTACGDDDRLRAEVERLLSLKRQAEFDRLTISLDRTAPATAHGEDRQTGQFSIGTPPTVFTVNCAHCNNRVELVAPATLDEVLCPACGSTVPLGPASSDLILSQIGERSVGRFELLSILGRGSFGTVYGARDPKLDRIVALKVLRAGNLASRSEIDRFLREARSMAQLSHSAIVQVYEVGEHDGLPFIVSELISGVPLSEQIKLARPTPIEAAKLVAEVAEALDYAHNNGVIHRDVKPSNIMIARDGRPYVMDFGLAKRDGGDVTMTVAGDLLGTPAYMSPEQASGEGFQVDARSDVYSLGVVLYELLSGERPFRGNRTMLINQVLNNEPRPLRMLDQGIPHDLETVCSKAMAKERSRRYPSAADLAADLRRFLAHEPVLARPIGRLTRLLLWIRRNPKVAALTGTVGALALGTVVAVAIAVTNAWSAKRELEASTLRMALQNARQLVQSGEPADALPWYVQALGLDSGDPGRESVHRTRLASIMKWSLRPSRVWWQPPPVETACLDAEARLLTCGAVGRIWNLHEPAPASEAIEANPQTDIHCFSAVLGERGPMALMTAGAGTRLRIVEPKSGDDVAPPVDGDTPVNRAIFGPGGRLLAMARGNTVEVRESATGRPVGIPIQHPDLVNDLAFSPDGRLVLVGYGGPEESLGEAWLWQVGSTSREPLRKFPHQDDVFSVVFSVDGRRAVTASFDRTARVWDVETGSCLVTLEHVDRVSLARLSPDGSLVATSSLTEARLWDVAKSIPVGAPMRHTGEIRILQFNSEGSRLLSAGDDETVRVWDTRNGLPAWEPLPHHARITAAMFTPDDEAVVTACTDGTTRLWEPAQGQHPRVSLQHAFYVRHAEIGGGGSRVVTASEDARARAWDAATGRPLSPALRHKNVVTSASISPDGGKIVTVHEKNSAEQCPARIWRATDGWTGADLGSDTATFAEFIPGTDRILVSGVGWGAVWDSSPRQVSWLEPPGPVAEPAESPDGRYAAAFCENGSVRVWSLPDGRSVGKAVSQGRVNFLAFCPKGARLVATGNDGKARIWDFATGRLVSTVAHHAPIRHAAFSPDGTRLVTAGDDRVAGIWDVETGAPLAPQLQHDAPVLRVTFSPDGRLVATGCGYDLYGASGYFRLWDAATGDFVSLPMRHGAGVHRLEFSPDGRQLLTASHRATDTLLWAVEPTRAPLEQLAEFAEVVAGARLDGRGGQTPIKPDEYAGMHAMLSARHPDMFSASRLDRAARLDAEARSYAATHHWSWAHRRLDALVAGDQENLGFRRRRGEARAHLNQWALAGDDYELAANAESEDDEIWFPAAAVFARSEDWARLSALSARLLDKFGQTERIWVCQNLATIASLAPDRPHDARATTLAERALKAQPGHHEPLAILGAALLRDNRLNEAADCLTESLKSHPEGGTIDAKCLLSLVERRRGNAPLADRLYREASMALDALLKLAPNDVALFWDLRLITEARHREAGRAR